MTTPLFLLRCKQLGLSMTELDLLTIGLINDMFTERENDDYDGWNEVAGQADFDNFRRRNASVYADSLAEGERNVIKELLPVIDNFERALNNSENVDQNYVEGVRLVYKQLMDVLTKKGLEEIDASGKFDPELHNAVMQGESDDAESGDILEVFQKGYKVKDRIIRHSMVKVAK